MLCRLHHDDGAYEHGTHTKYCTSLHINTAKRAMTIAADCCVYTNHNFTVETLGFEEGGDAPKASDGSTSEKGSEGGPKKGSEGSQKKGSEAPSPE